jgi:hypothetical protein
MPFSLRAIFASTALLLTVAVSVAAISWIDWSVVGQNKLASPQHATCGPTCLFFIVKNIFGKNVTQHDVARMCNDTQKGTSLLDLKRAAQQLGMDCTPCRISVEELSRHPLALFITRLQENHFCVVQSLPNQNFALIDPPNLPRLVKESDLIDKWEEIGLLIQSSRKSPDLLVEDDTLNVDRIVPDAFVNRNITFYNPSLSPIIINALEPGCSCITIAKRKMSMPPGGAISVPMVLNTIDRIGHFDVSIAINSTSVMCPDGVLYVKGQVISPLGEFVPKVMRLGQIQVDSVIDREAIFDGGAKILSVKTDDPFIQVLYLPPDSNDASRQTLRIRLACKSIGAHFSSINAITAKGPISLPILYSVVPRVASFPSAISLFGGGKKQRIRILLSSGTTAFKIASVSVKLGTISVQLDSATTDSFSMSSDLFLKVQSHRPKESLVEDAILIVLKGAHFSQSIELPISILS